jgi:hypothetical protein
MNKTKRKAKFADKKSSRAFMLSLYAGAASCIAAGSVEPVRSLFAQRADHCKIHSKAKDGGKGWRDVFSRFDAGKMPPVFAKGNGKLPFFAFSSLAGLDCPQAGACLYLDGDEANEVGSGFCYSFKAWRYPAAFFRQLVNSLRLRTEAGRAEIVKAWFELPRGRTVRLYVDGDFADPQILAFWMRLCFARPDLEVYGYSKSWRLLLSHDKASGGIWPRNYLLNLSSGGSGTEAEKAAVAALPIARGEFIAVPTLRDHGKAYQSRKHAGFGAYQADVKEQSGRKVFVCSGRCGDCTPSGHACGSEKFRGIPIAIGIH